MGDGQGNPFISNPFMQGAMAQGALTKEGAAKKKSKPPVPQTQPHRQTQRDQPTTKSPNSSDSLGKTPKTPRKSALPASVQPSDKTTSKSDKTPSKTVPKSEKGVKKTKSASRTKTKTKKKAVGAPSPLPTPSYTGNGYKVQVLAKIPMPRNTNMPSRDYLWFAVYPIIPRVGDCIFHDGRYFRVDAVFLYENTNAGWCADLEVSYYVRRQ